MSHNPNRLRIKSNPNRQRRVFPEYGKKHSDIVSYEGLKGLDISDLGDKKETKSGWSVTHFKNDLFEVVYKFISRRNSTGYVVNNVGDRFIKVLNGILLVQVKEENCIREVELRSGKTIGLTKGTVYELSTVGDIDVEVILCQNLNYDAGLDSLSDPVTNNDIVNVGFGRDVNSIPKRTDEKSKIASDVMRRRWEERNKKKSSYFSGRKTTSNEDSDKEVNVGLPGQVVVGVNPRPIGQFGSE